MFVPASAGAFVSISELPGPYVESPKPAIVYDPLRLPPITVTCCPTAKPAPAQLTPSRRGSRPPAAANPPGPRTREGPPPVTLGNPPRAAAPPPPPPGRRAGPGPQAAANAQGAVAR